MVRVKLGSGELAVFRTVEELSTAVRSGVVQVSAQVFNNDTQAWLSIQEVPELQAIQAEIQVTTARVARKSGGSARPVEPPPTPFPVRKLEGAPPADEGEVSDQAAKRRRSQPLPVPAPPRARGSHARSLIKVIGIATPVVLAAILAWAPEPSSGVGSVAGASTPSLASRRAERQRAAALTEALSEAIAPSRPLGIDDQNSPDSLAAPVESLTSRLGASQPKRPPYASAYAEAQETLEEAFALAGVTDLFSPGRFVTGDSIRAARRTVAAALNILRTYHDQEVMLDQTYFPGGAGNQSLRETYETAEAGRTLLSLADSLFGLLLREEGQYATGRGQIRFADPAVAQRYRDFRDRIAQQAGPPRPSPGRVAASARLGGFGVSSESPCPPLRQTDSRIRLPDTAGVR